MSEPVIDMPAPTDPERVVAAIGCNRWNHFSLLLLG
jgi:hypothetical protein